MISKKDKFIYIHIPRTGGTSVQSVLQKYMEYYEHPVTKDRVPVFPKHASLVHLLRDASLEKPSALEDYFVFSFVRNPWDLVVSRYHLGKCIGGGLLRNGPTGPLLLGYLLRFGLRAVMNVTKNAFNTKGVRLWRWKIFSLAPAGTRWIGSPGQTIL